MYILNIDYNIEHIPVRYMDSIDIRDIIRVTIVLMTIF
jgi:hypothetical protein